MKSLEYFYENLRQISALRIFKQTDINKIFNIVFYYRVLIRFPVDCSGFPDISLLKNGWQYNLLQVVVHKNHRGQIYFTFIAKSADILKCFRLVSLRFLAFQDF